MKKIGLFAAGGVAAIILIANLGHMIGLAVCVAILYYVAKRFVKTESTWKKIMWGILALIMVGASISNAPAIIGAVAAFVLYLIFKNWNKSKETKGENDPFNNFEKEWAKLK